MLGTQSERRRVAPHVPDIEDPERQADEDEQDERGEQCDDPDRKPRERNEHENELRGVHVPLLVLQDRVVELRIRRLAVEHRLRGRQIREAHVPRQQAHPRR